MLAIRIGFGLMALMFLGLAVHQGLLAVRFLGTPPGDTVSAIVASVGCCVAALGTAYTAWKVR